MVILSIIIIVGAVLVVLKNGFSILAVLGAIVGLFVGSSLGIAGGGTAVNGVFIFGGIGLIIGGLIKPNKLITKKRTHGKVYNSPPERINKPKVEGNGPGPDPDIMQLLSNKDFRKIAELIFSFERNGDRIIASDLLGEIKKKDFELHEKVVIELRKIRYKFYLK